MWKLLERCVIVEEMGIEIQGDIRVVSLWVCIMIQDWIVEYGVKRVSSFVEVEFCEWGFVVGEVKEDGFGNNMYKVFIVVGFVVMFN